MTRTIVLALLTTSALARADEPEVEPVADPATIVDEVPPEVVPSPARFEALLGMHAGNLPVQGADLMSLGLDLEAGLRFDRLALLAETDLMWLPDSTSTSGSGHRYGLNVNYTIAKGVGAWRRPKLGYPQFPVRARADLWLTAGFGEETLHVNVADLSRRDFSIGLGGHIGEEDHARRWAPFAGFFTLRAVIARDPDPLSGAAARDTGVHATGGTGALDYAIWFDFGVMFGG